MTIATNGFNNVQTTPTEQEYAMIFDPQKAEQTGYIVATLKNGSDIEYTDFVAMNALKFLEPQDPLAQICPAAIVYESNVTSRDYSNRTDISPLSEEQKRAVSVLAAQARALKT